MMGEETRLSILMALLSSDSEFHDITDLLDSAESCYQWVVGVKIASANVEPVEKVRE